ncbi:MAG: hypothetical protein A2746_01960 [Candidatus Yanofskybacteria bacterium RIFCSPHIGHO2_01_FULL_44_22]|uniref:DUF5673 domain-containing protein n=1 Tax=Candidatus Yanofskybacteria bacterium RIFCSPHIGHO2_01_FULL_44_22 TaxID=1802669 RepID=A0A1F8EY39_9BACT|nr:MAG: hypothetical protein A3H17_03375 [Candidatus Levybacteria bacterium RIFCSPLOWO2_12_FULL_37_14]OGN05792.1 MAG: hypothetical protein A2746_01960 [Candidatus Yanofskybacteria bacterium RIFCSPHIGHO2_01_FULL_44_22]
MSRIIDLKKIASQDKSPTPPADVKIDSKKENRPTTKKAAPDQPDKQTAPQESPALSWEIQPREHLSPKIYSWLTAGGLLATAGVLIFFKKDYLTTIFLVLSSVVLLLQTAKKHPASKIAIGGLGISVGSNLYPFKELRTFWLDYVPGNAKELSLEPKKWYLPYIKIPVAGQNPVELRKILMNFLPEKEHEISLADIIGKKLGL